MATSTATEMPTATQRPLRRADVRVQELDGEALIFDPVSADTHRLNETALFIWRECNARRDASSIAKRLTEVYDVSYDNSLEYVTHTLGVFRERGLTVDTSEDGA